MLNPAPFVDVNGIFVSRTSCTMSVDSLPIRLFKGVHWNKKLTRGKTWGNRVTPRGRGRGKFEPSGDLEVYIEDWTIIRNFLAAKNPARGWMLNSFTLTVTAFEEAIGGAFTVQLVGCTVSEDDNSVSDGDDQISRKLTLDVMNIIEDGIPAVLENTGIF
jgi:hypothetical protein